MKLNFTAANYPRINTLIRCIVFWAVFIGLLVCSGSVASFFPPRLARLVLGILATAAAFLVTFVFLKFEKCSFDKIGLVWEKGTVLRFVKGVLLGVIIFTGMILVLLSVGGLQLQKNTQAFTPGIFLYYLPILPFAFMEEIAFRAYPFVKLNKVFGLRLTQLIIATAFALYHVINGWDVYIAFTGPFVWAFVFGLAAVWSNGISMPTGIHTALNMSQLVIGMNGTAGAIWKLSYKDGSAATLVGKTEHVGLLLQGAVLLCAVLLTEFYIRKKVNRAS